MSKFGSKRQRKFLADLAALPSLDDEDNDLTIRCKFNFSYFDSSQNAGQNFSDWDQVELSTLLGKLKEFTKKPLDYWRHQRVGSGSLKMLETYGWFPSKSDFFHPKHIPHQAQWGRFRLGSKVRLVGFTIPTEYHQTLNKNTGEFFDINTFYVVFLDRNHKFYPKEKK